MSWKDVARTVAPFVGKALGGPAGGIVANAVARKWLGKDEASPDEITEAIELASPEKLVELREIDKDLKVELAKVGITDKQLDIMNTQGARDLAAKTSLLPQAIISTIFISAFAAICYAVFSGAAGLEGTSKDVAIYLLGILSAGVAQIMNFWFGSSSGSKEKDAFGKFEKALIR